MSSSTKHVTSPHSSLSLRSRKFFRIWNVPPDPSSLNGEKSVPSIEVQGEIINSQWSNNGAVLAVTFQDQGLVLYTLDESVPNLEELRLQPFPLPLPEQLRNLPTKQLKWIVFSPKGTYLCTFWIPNGLGLAELNGPNYYVWRITRSERGDITGASIVFSDTYKSLSSPGPMQWRDDEQIRVFTRNGTLHIYAGHDFEKPPLAVLSIAPRFSISIAPYCEADPDAVSITMFAPASQAGNTPGEVRFLLCKITQREKDAEGQLHVRSAVPVRVGIKELSGVDGCDFMWSPSGRICMMMTSTLVDAAGDNYGSVGDLWLCDLRNGGMKGGEAAEDERLTSVKENMGMQQSGTPVDIEYLQIRKINERVTQDAKWSPTADEFVLIEGKAPSDIYLYDGLTGERVHTFAKGYKNQIVWNRQGDMVAIGGFGNLAGDLSFYHRDSTRQVTLINEWRESCTVLCDWSPCGNYFFTASVRPRMNVDNQIKLWNREGTQLLHIPFDELNGVEWRRAPDINFPPPPVPKPAERMQNKSTYRPRNWANTSADSQLMTRYYNGEITENELPEELRKRIASRTNRGNGARNFSEKARYGTTDKACDTAMDWRSSEPVSEEKKEVSEGAQSEVAPSQQLSSSNPPGKAIDVKRGADESTTSAAQGKKEPLSRKARKEQNRTYQAQQPQSAQAPGSAASTKRGLAGTTEKSAKSSPPAVHTEHVTTDSNEVTTKKQPSTTPAEPVAQVLKETVTTEPQKETGSGPPATSNLSWPPEQPEEILNSHVKSESEVPPVPVTLPSSVQIASKVGAATNTTYGGVSTAEPSIQYSMPQKVVGSLAKPSNSGATLPYLPQQLPYHNNINAISKERPVAEQSGVVIGGSGYNKWDATTGSEASRMTAPRYAPPTVASPNVAMLAKDITGRVSPNHNTSVPVMPQQHPQTRQFDNTVTDGRLPLVMDKLPTPPIQTQPSHSSLSDNNILSLLQSILPSHAKVHVRAEPEASLSSTATLAGSTTSGEGTSAFLRYFDKSTQSSTQVYPSRPQSKVSTRTPSQPMQSSYTTASAPPPAFPNPRPRDELTEKERELEQARFIALIEQAGLKLPNLSFAGNRPAATASVAPAPAYASSMSQSRQRQRWGGPAPSHVGPLINTGQAAQKVKPQVPMSDQYWPSIQDAFPNKEVLDAQNGPWGVKAQETKRRGGAYPTGVLGDQRFDNGGGRGPASESGNLEMDANLRELLKSLQSQSSQQNSAEYAVKELLQTSVNNARTSQYHQQVVDSRKRVQGGWATDVRRVHGQQSQPSVGPHDIEVKQQKAAGYESLHPQANRRVWQYVDPKGVVQGPFSRREMRAWWEKGYFAGDLPVRCDMQEEFVPLQEMFPGGEKVFAEE